jgi:hypothetical protein
VFIPEVQSQAQAGNTLRIIKVGFLVASQEDCRKVGIAAQVKMENKCFLPTVLVDQSGLATLHRLQVDLTDWVINCVALARTGKNVFPTEVEFGQLNN